MTWPLSPRLPLCLGAFATSLLTVCPALAADAVKIRFDLPADVVARSIRTFARQSGQEILISAELGQKTRTQPVQGEFTPREAVDRMLSRTGLVARQDAKTGVMVIMRDAGPNADPAPSLRKLDHQPTPPAKTMRRKTSSALLASMLATLASAQPLSAQTADPGGQDKVIELTPFIVSADTERGYQATETLAGMRLKTDIKDVGAAIDVFTEDFLNDVGATGMNDALKYSPNVQYADFPSADDPTNFEQWFSSSYISRGVKGNTVLTDFFPRGLMPIDRYNTDNLTVMRGPNAILFGVGSPSGVIGASSKRASLSRNATSLRFLVDTNSSLRTEVDVSRVLIPNRLAFRGAAVLMDKHTDQIDSLERRNAVFGTLTYKPFPRTTITVNGERGIRQFNFVQNSIASDAYTPWVQAGKPLVSGKAPTFSTAVGSGLENISTGSYLVYVEGSNQPVQDWRNMARGALWSNTVVSGAPGSGLILAADRSLMQDIGFNRTNAVIPLNANLWGDVNRNKEDYNGVSVFLQQNLLRDLDVELAWDEFTTDYVLRLLGYGRANKVYVDPNLFLPDGTPNPNVGLPYVEAGSGGQIARQSHGSEERFITRRATLSYKLDLDQHKLFGNFGLGSYLFAGLAQESDYRKRALSSIVVNVTPLPGNPSSNPLGQAANALVRRYYLQPGDTGFRHSGPDTFSQAAVLGNPPATTGPLKFEERVAGPSPGYQIQETTSYVAAVQGAWWKSHDGAYSHLTAMYGWREDTQFNVAQSFARNAAGEYPISLANGRNLDLIEAAGVWRPGNEVTVHTKSYNATFRPVASVRLFYNYSDIFRAGNASFLDVFGDPLRPSFGTTEDYGVKLDLWHGRVYLTATRFNTAVVDTSFDNTTPVRNPINDIYNAISRPELILERPWSYRDDTTKGYEYELTANLARNWDLRLTFGIQKTEVSAAFDDWVPYFAQNTALWQQHAGTPLLNPSAGYTTVADAIVRANQRLSDARAIIGQQPADQRSRNSSLYTTYRFSSGKLAGLRVGGGYRWSSANIIGYARDAAGNLDPARPFWGKSQLSTDLSVGYSRSFWNGKYTWDVQANVYNVLGEEDILPRQAVDDGTGQSIVVRSYLLEPRMVQVTTSLRF